MSLPFQGDHWLPSFNFNVEEWFDNDRYETLAICRTGAFAPELPRGFCPPFGAKII